MAINDEWHLYAMKGKSKSNWSDSVNPSDFEFAKKNCQIPTTFKFGFKLWHISIWVVGSVLAHTKCLSSDMTSTDKINACKQNVGERDRAVPFKQQCEINCNIYRASTKINLGKRLLRSEWSASECFCQSSLSLPCCNTAALPPEPHKPQKMYTVNLKFYAAVGIFKHTKYPVYF